MAAGLRRVKKPGKLDLTELRRHAREYVEIEAQANVLSLRFKQVMSLFGQEDAIFLVETDDKTESLWWVVGGSTPMNLYARSKFSSPDEVFSFHQGLMLRLAERQMTAASVGKRRYDAFISHATEDKDTVVRPLTVALARAGFRIWFDETELRVGDGLRRSIDKGLAKSNYGIVILSKAFFAKNWPKYELDGLAAKEIKGKKVILPVWHGVSAADVFRFSPSLADKVALKTSSSTIEQIARSLGRELGRA